MFLVGPTGPKNHVSLCKIYAYAWRGVKYSIIPLFIFLIMAFSSSTFAEDTYGNVTETQGTYLGSSTATSVAESSTINPTASSGGGGKGGSNGSQSVPDTNARLVVNSFNSTNEQVGDALRMEVGGNSINVQPANYKKYIPSIMKSISGTAENSIISFLRRPMIQSTGVFQTTDGPATFPVTGLFTGLDDPVRLSKLKGVFSIRADTVITIELNGNPFQQGRYLIASMPTGGAAYPGVGISLSMKSHRFSRVQITQLNHVQFDICNDKKASLVCPFISGMASHNLATTGNDFKRGNPGVFFLYPYRPLMVASGANTVPWTIWIHYENVEIFGTAIPQMSKKKGKFTRGKDLVQTEVEEGPFTRGLSMATDVTTALSNVPFLSSFMSPLAYVSNAAAGLARHFGWSKPLLLTDQRRIYSGFASYLATSDMKSTAHPLSLFAENHISALDGFGGSELDELSIDFLKSIPSYFGNFTWTDADAIGSVLYTEYMDPSKYYQSYVDGISTITSYTPVSFLGTAFNQWQGSLIITIKFAKTMFHSGRLAFVYNLQDPSNTLGTINTANLPYVYKEIIDITKGTEFSFELPYIANTDWSFSAGNSDGGQGAPGKWAILIIDPLIAPSTVPSSITGILEVRGGKSLHFAAPRRFPAQPTTIVNFQSGNALMEEVEAFSGVMTGTNVVEDYHLSCANTTGEIIDSLRHLLKRGGIVYNSGNTTGAACFFAAPHVTNWMDNQPAAVPVGTVTLDYYNLISSFYALGRGGFRTHLCTSSGTSTATAWLASYVPYGPYLTSNWLSILNATAPVAYTTFLSLTSNAGLTLTKAGELQGVQSPQYLESHSRNLQECIAYGTTASVPSVPSSPMVDKGSLIFRAVGTATASNVYRAVSDDHSLGGFISIPAMFISLP